MTALYLIMLTAFTAYILFVVKKYGIQESVSNSYYKLPEKQRWIFTIALWSFAFPAIVLGVEKSGLAFLAGAGIMFVGAAPAFRGDKMEETVHVTGALTGVIGGLIFMIVTGLWTVAVVTLAVMAFIKLSNVQNKTWWLELAAFYGYSIAVGILNFNYK